MATKTLMALAASFLTMAAFAGPFRVAFVGSGAHGQEFSSIPMAFPKEGWTFRDFSPAQGENASVARERLLAALDEIDLVALKPLAPDVFSAADEQWKAFLERGGTVAITDACYPDKYVWTDFLGPDYRHPDGEGFAGWHPSLLDRLSPEPTIRTFPSAQVDGGILWYHYNMTNAGSAWKTLVRCARHHQPCAIKADYGTGFVYLTTLRCPYPSFFENLRAAAEAKRGGLEVVEATGFELTNANFTASLLVRRADAAALSPRGWSAELRIASATNDQCVCRATAKGTVGKDKCLSFSIKARNEVRGPARVVLTLSRPKESEIVLIDRLQTFEELIEIELPRYRATVSAKRRRESVDFAFRLNPAKEKLMRGGFFSAKVIAPDGKSVVASTKRRRFSGTRAEMSLAIPLGAPAGKYTIHVDVTGSDKRRHSKSASFTIAEPTPTQVVVDQDNTLLRGGKPWFPLGMYHASPKHWQEVHDAGFDLQQSMNWFDGDFPRLAEMGQKLLYETKHNYPENMAIWAKRLSTEPYACMTYVTDEPDDTLVWKWEACRRAVCEADPDHPTFAVLLHPTSFRYQRDIADILATDVYPLGRDGKGDMTKIEQRIRECRAACEDRKPVLAVLQSFGWETQDKFRAMAYLAIVSGAKGILWYCWEEGNPSVGLHTNPSLLECARGLLAEIRGLVPAILSGQTKELSLAQGRVRALLCGTKETGVKLICVNPTDEEAVVNDAPKASGAPATFTLPPAGTAVFPDMTSAASRKK